MLFGHVHEKPFNFDKPAHFQKLLNDLGPERNKALHDEKRLLEAYFFRDKVEYLHGRPLRRGYPNGELPLLPFGKPFTVVAGEETCPSHHKAESQSFSRKPGGQDHLRLSVKKQSSCFRRDVVTVTLEFECSLSSCVNFKLKLGLNCVQGSGPLDPIFREDIGALAERFDPSATAVFGQQVVSEFLPLQVRSRCNSSSVPFAYELVYF